MRKFLLFLFLLLSVNTFSQPGDTTVGKIRPKLMINDTVLNKLQRLDDSMAEVARKKSAAEDLERINQNSINYFAQLSKERRAKQKRDAIIRIAIGVTLFIVLIVGLRRRRVKK